MRRLKYFIAVAEEGNIGRAAARLNMAQPPLTRQIQNLESDLGVMLFARTARGVELTDAARELLRDARAIRSMFAAATERAQRAGKGQVGRLDVGVYGSAMFDIVPRLLRAFKKDHPDVKVVLHPGQTPQQVIALKQGRIQIAFERLLPLDPQIQVAVVAREPLYVALNDHHALAQQKSVHISALKSEPMIVNSSPGSQVTSRVMELCRVNGFEPVIAHESEDVIAAAALAASGYGICFVPRSLTNLQMPHLAYRPLRARGDARMELYSLTLRGEGSPVLNALLRTITKSKL